MMAHITSYDVQYYLDRLRTLTLEAMQLNLRNKDASMQLMLIGLCCEAMEGKDEAIRILKQHGIDPLLP